MPYLVYKIHPPRRLEYLESHEGYGEARRRVRALRATLPPIDPGQVRMIFAKDRTEAERLLSEVREAPPAGDE